MKIVGITACPTGIAHTYITKKKIIEAAKACGYPCRIETQGSSFSNFRNLFCASVDSAGIW
mgnify:CR=1 FL=1